MGKGNWVLAVDGGGTKTTAALASPGAEVIRLPDGPGCNPQDGPAWALAGPFGLLDWLLGQDVGPRAAAARLSVLAGGLAWAAELAGWSPGPDWTGPVEAGLRAEPVRSPAAG